MNESVEPSTSEKEAKPSAHHSIISGLWNIALLIILLIGMAAAALAGRQWLLKEGAIEPKTVAVRNATAESVDDARLVSLEERTRRLQLLLDDSMARLDKLEKAPSSPIAKAENEANVTTLQEDVTRLKNNATALQAQVESSAASWSKAMNVISAQIDQMEKTQNSGQSQLTLAVAFIQLQTAANSGIPFKQEISNLKKMSAQDSVAAATLAQLEPLAETGVPSVSTLREEFENLAGTAKTALRRTTAATWQERLIAELKSLITVRRVNSAGEDDDIFAAVDHDLAAHHVNEALQKLTALPNDVQIVLKDWRAKAEARQNLDNALNALSTHLTGADNPAPSTTGANP